MASEATAKDPPQYGDSHHSQNPEFQRRKIDAIVVRGDWTNLMQTLSNVW